jgi:3-deoxy-manno-octulosonate cytidylyltransferase (CMP-KDO synthetase)
VDDAYAILIPARLGSERLPEKVLLRESGKFLVQHVYERALAAPGRPRVLVLTDDERVAEAVRSFGGQVRMTRADHASGTDRCAEVAADLDEAVVINLQGDEPLFEPGDLADLAVAVGQGGADIATLAWPFEDPAQMADPNAVKAVFHADGEAITFTRLARPEGDVPAGAVFMHHVGIYAFRRERLLEFPSLPRTENERRERLEQLRALDHGWRIRVLTASKPAFGIDTREDYEAFLAIVGRS